MIRGLERVLWVWCKDWKLRDLLGGYSDNWKRKGYLKLVGDGINGDERSELRNVWGR